MLTTWWGEWEAYGPCISIWPAFLVFGTVHSSNTPHDPNGESGIVIGIMQAMGLHATIATLLPALVEVRVVGGGGGQWGIQDATGASVVIEYVAPCC